MSAPGLWENVQNKPSKGLLEAVFAAKSYVYAETVSSGEFLSINSRCGGGGCKTSLAPNK